MTYPVHAEEPQGFEPDRTHTRGSECQSTGIESLQ